MKIYCIIVYKVSPVLRTGSLARDEPSVSDDDGHHRVLAFLHASCGRASLRHCVRHRIYLHTGNGNKIIVLVYAYIYLYDVMCIFGGYIVRQQEIVFYFPVIAEQYRFFCFIRIIYENIQRFNANNWVI